MDKFFKRNFDTSSAADPEEVQMLRQKIGTMEEVVKRTEDELRHERENFTSLQAKVEMWKGKVKDKTAKDRERIAQLEDELKVMRTLRESTDASMTADIQSLVDKSLLTLRDKHTQQLQTKQQELSMARKTISERESENASIRSEMETLQQQYIEIQQRFAQEIESLSRHHEKEVEQLNESLRGLERVHELEKEIAKREDEIRTLESHSNQQALLFGELQRENAEFKAGNNELQEKLKEALNKLTVLQDKQQTWKEAVKNMKMQDEKLIHELRDDLEKQRRATSADSGLNPSQEEKLLQWKEKVKNEKLKDLEKIKNLTSELNTSKLQMGKAQKLISNIAMLLAEDPPSVANTINAVNNYVASMEDESTEIFQTPSLSSFTSSVFTTQKNQEEPLDKPPALPDQHIQLSEAVRQRDEVQQELQRTSEELASIREASGAETVSLQAQLGEAVRQRDEVQQELQRTSEELASIREASGAETVSLKAQLGEAVRQRDEVQQELQRTSEELASIREASGAETVSLQAQLGEAVRQRDEVQQELQRTSEELASIREASGAETVSLQAQLGEAVRQRDEVQQELQRTSEELASIREASGAETVSLQAQLGEAVRQRDEVQQELQRTSEELASIREASGAETVSLQAQLGEAVRQRDEVQQELQRTSEELASIREASGAETVSLQAQLGEAVRQRDEVQQELQRTSEELASIREASGAETVSLQAQLGEAVRQRDEVQQELQRTSEELASIREASGAETVSLQAQLGEAVRQRDEVQQELQRTSEELASIREASGAETVSLQAQLGEAVRQRDEVQQELQRTSEELASIREASGAETVSLQAQLGEAVRQRDEVQQELQRTSEELASIREASGAETVSLQAQLGEAVRQRDEVQQELQRTSEELASIREASGAETVSLQAQLGEALRQREGLDQECVRLRGRVEELKKECEAVEGKKVNEIRGVEEKLLLWKEKVLATKANDDARIASLDALVSSLRDDVKRLVGCFLELLAVGGELVAKKPLAEGDGEVDVSCVLSIVDNFKCRLAESMNSVSNGKETGSLPEVLLSLDAKVATAQMERNEVSAALQHCQQELETAKSRLSEAETNLHSSASPELLAELEMKNSHLEEKCELLRKEMKRQRDAFQRERAQRGLSLSSAMREDGDAARSVASGGVFEKDMLSLANQQSQRDSEIRQLRSQLHALEKENAVLKRECDYNNGLVAQYTKDIEVLKGKERIQQSMEYVRNVILQFLCCSSEEIRVRMVPVIATVLEFSPKEKLDVQRAIPSCPRLD